MSTEQKEMLPPEEAATVDPEAFKDGFVLTTGETSYLLGAYLKDRILGNSAFQMPAVVKKTKEYADKFKQIQTDDAMQKVREALLNQGVKEYEYGILVNMMPDTVEEACVLLPSLKDPARFPEGKLEQLLEELAGFRAYQ